MATSDRISPASVLRAMGALEGLLTGVKTNGGRTDTPSIWSACMMAHDARYVETRDRSIRLRTLTETHELLCHLAQLAETEIKLLNNTAHSERKNGARIGLHSLPDELIQQVFVAAKAHDPMFEATALQINRRSRRITLDTPALWTSICNLQPRSHIDVFLRCAARNVKAPLSLCLRDHISQRNDENVLAIQDFLKPISTVRSDWNDIRFEYRSSLDFRNIERKGYAHACPVPSSARSVTAIYADYLGTSHYPIGTSLHSQWSLAPSAFKGCNTLDLPAVASNLRTVELTFDSKINEWSRLGIYTAMQSMLSVESLTITWIAHTDPGLTEDVYDPPMLELPALKSLTIHLIGAIFDHGSDSCPDSERFADIFRRVDFPVLARLCVHVSHIYPEAGVDMIDNLIRRHGAPGLGTGLVHLRHLYLHMEETWYNLDRIKDLKLELLQCMPNLETVFIQWANTYQYRDNIPLINWRHDREVLQGTSTPHICFPHLRKVVFKLSQQINVVFLESLLRDCFDNVEPGVSNSSLNVVVIECPLATGRLVKSQRSRLQYFMDKLTVIDKSEDAKDSDLGDAVWN